MGRGSRQNLHWDLCQSQWLGSLAGKVWESDYWSSTDANRTSLKWQLRGSLKLKYLSPNALHFPCTMNVETSRILKLLVWRLGSWEGGVAPRWFGGLGWGSSRYPIGVNAYTPPCLTLVRKNTRRGTLWLSCGISISLSKCQSIITGTMHICYLRQASP